MTHVLFNFKVKEYDVSPLKHLTCSILFRGGLTPVLRRLSAYSRFVSARDAARERRVLFTNSGDRTVSSARALFSAALQPYPALFIAVIMAAQNELQDV